MIVLLRFGGVGRENPFWKYCRRDRAPGEMKKSFDIGQFPWLKFPDLRRGMGEIFFNFDLELPTILNRISPEFCSRKHKKTAILKVCRF